eukprot:gene10921-biopygen4817
MGHTEFTKRLPCPQEVRDNRRPHSLDDCISLCACCGPLVVLRRRAKWSSCAATALGLSLVHVATKVQLPAAVGGSRVAQWSSVSSPTLHQSLNLEGVWVAEQPGRSLEPKQLGSFGAVSWKRNTNRVDGPQKKRKSPPGSARMGQTRGVHLQPERSCRTAAPFGAPSQHNQRATTSTQTYAIIKGMWATVIPDLLRAGQTLRKLRV